MDQKIGKKVFVAMSGGVDSSVAALLLKERGYDCTGVFMKNWSEDGFGRKYSGRCTWKKDAKDAAAVCRQLRIPFKIYNFEKEYEREVISDFFRNVRRGLTPNPDVVCNRVIKFGFFLKKARKDGADLIATGHYAKKFVSLGHSKFGLAIPKDKTKDQTYFLSSLKESQIKHSLFPLADFEKTQVRALARKHQLPTAEKKESMGICFVGDVNFGDFLDARIKPKLGQIVGIDSKKIIGQHQGLHKFTLGQRKGIGQGGGLPYYVSGKNPTNNRLYVARGANNPALYRKEIFVRSFNWISEKPATFPFFCKGRIRHLQPLQNTQIQSLWKNVVKIRFSQPQWAPTPGQYCVLYKNSKMLGGGIIQKCW